ncbi:MAG: hypothetical protein KDD36_05495 [Flavobacteriales bacterium]|nr:hypothetical protein [Flavobacteriales bacterium]
MNARDNKGKSNKPPAKKGRLNRQMYVFVSCLLLSALFWLLITLSNNFTTRLTVGLTYEGLPEDKVLVNKLPDRAEMEVYGNGFDLLGMVMRGSLLKMNIDLGRMRAGRDERGHMYILTNANLTYFSYLLGDQVRVSDVKPDSLRLRYDVRISKKVPIRFNGNIRFRKQFQLKDELIIQPDSIVISGPNVVIAGITEMLTEKLMLDDVHETYSHVLSVHVDSVNGTYEVSQRQVKVEIPVESFTEDSRMVAVRSQQKADSVNLRLFPDSIRVTYLVGLSHMDEIRSEDFEAIVDLGTQALTENKTLKVTLEKSPDFIRSVRIQPARVEFLIRK